MYYPALRHAGLIDRPLYNLRHTFAVFMLEAGENPGWVARQMRHTSVEMLWRRYARWWPHVARSDGRRAEQWWHEEAEDSGSCEAGAESPKVVEG